MTEKERKAFLGGIGVAGAIMQRLGVPNSVGYALDEYRADLRKAWGLSRDPITVLHDTDGILAEVNGAMATLHPDWTNSRGKKWTPS